MHKNILRRVLTCVLSVGMVMSLGGVTALATEIDDNTEISETNDEEISDLDNAEFSETDEAEAYVEETEESTELDAEVKSSGTIEVDTDSLPDNDELFAEYVDWVFYGDSGIEMLADTGPQYLEGYSLELYTQIKEMVTEVANGETDSTIFSLDVDDFYWTAEELGITSPDEAEDAVDEKLNEMMEDVYFCLLADCSYELYWYDKTKALDFVEAFDIYTNPDGTLDEVDLVSLDIYTFVEDAYQDPDSEDPETTVNIEKTSAAKKAAANAQDIVAEYASLPTEWEKAVAYKEVICDLVSYDYEAEEDPDMPYGDPWQMIYVFDEDPETNVVCEGYSKAYKYLCDKGMEDAEAYLSVGYIYADSTLAGVHMWNILNLDGCNYLVDVTNSDTGSVGADGGLFLVDDTDAVSYDPGLQYSFAVPGLVITYEYMMDSYMYVYPEEVLTLGSTYALTITQQPSDLTLPVGYSDATLSVKATTDSGTIAYQWYQKDEDGNGTPIEGATDSTLAIPDGMEAGTTVTYYCTAMQTIRHTGGDEDYVVTSDDAVVEVAASVPTVSDVKITASAETKTYDGSGITLTVIANVTPDNAEISYQWYKVEDGTETMIEGATSSQFTTGSEVSDSGTYKCVVTATYGSFTAKDSDEITVTITEPSVDKQQLKEEIEEAEKKNKDDYTTSSWSVFEKALAEAEEVLNDPNATQDEVDAALDALETAIGNLEEKTDSGTSGTGTGGNSGNTGSSGSAGDKGGSGISGTGGTSGTGSTKTGDTNAGVWYLLVIIAAGAVIVSLGVRRRTVRK